MAAVLVHHKVADFDAWLPAFEAHAVARKAAGVNKAIVWRSESDPNDVFILMKAENLDALKALGQSEDLKATMLKAGVQAPVEMHFLEHAGAYEN